MSYTTNHNHTNQNVNINHAIGCLVGQAVGDALGISYEFTTKEDANHQIKENQNLKIKKKKHE